MPFEFKCRKCGVIIPVYVLRTGEQAYCRECHTINIVPDMESEYTEPPVGGIPDDPKLRAPIPGQSIDKSGVAPRSVTEIIGESFSVFLNNFLLICGIYAIVYLPTFGFEYLAQTIASRPESISLTLALTYLLALFIYLLVYFVLYSTAAVSISYLVSKYYLKQETAFMPSLRAAIYKAPKFLPVYLFATIIIFVLFITIIGIPVAIYLALCWMVIFPAITLENHSIMDYLRRSRSLTKGYLWKIFGLTLLVILIILIPLIIASFIPWYLRFLILIPIYSIALIYPLILYFDLRARKEDYDLEKLRFDVQSLDAAIGD